MIAGDVSRTAEGNPRAGNFPGRCATEEDRQSLSRLSAEIWPNAKIIVGSDRDSGLAAALGHADGIVVNAGSGSSVTGRRDKKIENAGGWGHVLGDAGGGYFLSLQALRLILREYDLHRGEMQFTGQGFACVVSEQSQRARSLGADGRQNGSRDAGTGRL